VLSRINDLREMGIWRMKYLSIVKNIESVRLTGHVERREEQYEQSYGLLF
jgi:hypothetical protein